MSEILFQGKRMDNGEWIEGNYVYDYEAEYIAKIDKRILCHTILPETVSRYSGFEATNGKIFEHHIIRSGEYYFIVTYGRCGKPDGGYEGFYLQPYDERTQREMSRGLRNDIHYWIDEYGAEIIGNVLDEEEEDS